MIYDLADHRKRPEHHPVFLKAFSRTRTGSGFFLCAQTAGMPIEQLNVATLGDYSCPEIEMLMAYVEDMTVEQAVWILPMLLSYTLSDPDDAFGYELRIYDLVLRTSTSRWEAFTTMRKWSRDQRTSLSELLALCISKIQTQETAPHYAVDSLLLLQRYANMKQNATPEQVEQLTVLL